MEFHVTTVAKVNFDYALKDLQRLRALSSGGASSRPGRPDPKLEVYKRSAVILTVTAWESYIEDTLRAAATARIDAAESANDVMSAFAPAALGWLSDEKRRKPEFLLSWTGDGWKAKIKEQLQKELEKLNTPDVSNISKLSTRYLGMDLPSKWYWQSTSAIKAKKWLDQLINLRGKLAHRTKEFYESAQVKHADVVKSIELVRHLVDRTEKVVGEMR